MSNKGMIRVRGIQCPRCEQKIASLYNHDFRRCNCGYCFVDGGQSDYYRVGYGVGLPDGMENDGTVTKEVWEKVNAETAAIGRPKSINFYIKGKRVTREDTFPRYIDMIKLFEEVKDVCKEQQRDRSKVRGNVGSRGNKPTNKRTTRRKSKA